MLTHQHPSRDHRAVSAPKGQRKPVARAVHHSTRRPSAPVYEPARLIDPTHVRRSQTPNRASAAFGQNDPDYAELDESIRTQKGNTVPILVRMLTVKEKGEGACRYELIAGERRLRACRAHGLPVLATVVKNIDPVQQLVLTMTENTGRCSLLPFEHGRQVNHAMKITGKSQNEIAAILGHDKGQISKAAGIAKLPSAVVAAFTSPRDIRYTDLPKIQQALERASDRVVKAAQKLKKAKLQFTVDEVVERLTAAAKLPANTPTAQQPKSCIVPALYVAGNLIANTRLDKSGLLEVSMKVPLSEKDQVKLLDRIQRFVARTLLQESGVNGALTT